MSACRHKAQILDEFVFILFKEFYLIVLNRGTSVTDEIFITFTVLSNLINTLFLLLLIQIFNIVKKILKIELDNEQTSWIF